MKGEINMQKELLDYIKSCYTLEKSIFTQKQIIKAYDNTIRNIRSRQLWAYYGIYNQIPYFTYKKSDYYGQTLSSHEWYTEQEMNIYFRVTNDIKFTLLEKLSENARKKRKLEAYNTEAERLNEKVRRDNEAILVEKKKQEDLVQVELQNAIGRANKTVAILKEYYEKDIIFPKYRAFVPISSIYEYLVSGRCKTLPEAYNKYEEELRQNIIIEKLDTIINKLDRIEQNQYMLYDAILSMNSNLEKISSGINSALNTMSQIEENTYVSAYNSKIIADNEQYQSSLLTFDVVYRTLSSYDN